MLECLRYAAWLASGRVVDVNLSPRVVAALRASMPSLQRERPEELVQRVRRGRSA